MKPRPPAPLPSVVRQRCALALFSAVAGFATGLLPAARAQPASSPCAWKSVAIGGGGFVSGILFHPAQRDLVYARTDVGGAYRWDAAAGAWRALNDDIGGLDNEFMRLGVLSFAIDPSDTTRLYLACGQYTTRASWNPDGVILASPDRGATWTRTPLPGVKLGGNEDGRNTGERLAVDPNDGRILFLGTSQDGLWRSADHGATWTRVAAFVPTRTTLVLFDKTTGRTGNATQTIFVGASTTSAASLWRSTDGGASWNAVDGQPASLMPHHVDIGYGPDGARTLFVAYSNAPGPNGASAGAVWKLDLASGAWTNITPAAGAWGYAGVSVDAADPRTLVASTLDRWSQRDDIYRSTDGGATWQSVLQSGVFDFSAAPWAAASTPHWIADVKIDPFNSSRALFVTGYGLFATGNLAAAQPRWSFLDAGLEETVPLALASPPSGAPLVSAVGDIDGFRHDDLGAAPATRLSPLEGTNTSIDFAAAAPAKMVRTFNAATRGAFSADGGTTWTLFARAPAPTADGGVIAIAADGATFVWSQQNTPPHRSTDNGASWSPCAGAPAGGTRAPVADRVNAAKFYLYDGTAGRVYVSTDAAANFSAAASVPTGAAPLRAVPGLEGNLWLPCWSGGLRRSTDAGASFSTIASVQEAYAIGFGKAAPGQTHPAVFIWGKVGGAVGFFRSDNAGETWLRINDDGHQFGYINALTGDPRVFGRVYLATSGRGIIYGEPAPALAAFQFAPFTAGARGSFQPAASAAAPLTFSAEGLPAWAQLSATTGAIAGTPTDPPGTVRQATLRATDPAGNVSAVTLNLLVAAPGDDLRLTNLSARAHVGTGADILIPGFVVSGRSPRRLLMRAIGPTLANFGLAGTLADPQLTLLRDGATLAMNSAWENQPAAVDMRAAFAATGAFALPSGSRDAALLATLGPGGATAKIESITGGTGLALLEIYDATIADGGQLVNLSTRAIVGAGSDALMPGLVLAGGGARRLLVRASGPALAAFGVAGTLADPTLTLYAGSTVLATNDDWNDNFNVDDIRAAARSAGAFAFPENGKDAALLVTLAQGTYTLQVAAKNGASGVALVEVYLLP